MILYTFIFSFFFFNDTATTEIYTLSLHDALPILSTELPPLSLIRRSGRFSLRPRAAGQLGNVGRLQKMRFYMIANTEHQLLTRDRKSTRLNSSHGYISYAVFCLKKKTTN